MKLATNAVTFNPFEGRVIQKVIHTTQSQAEIWIACKLGGENANRSYNESITLILEGELDYVSLENAVQKVIERHEALRSVFSPDGLVMSVLEHDPIKINQVDLSQIPSNQQDVEFTNFLAKDANYTFDLIRGPLLKISILKFSELKHKLVITAHHIICDGWSFGIILKELGSFYSSYAQGKSYDIPQPETFSSFADDKERFAESKEYEETVNYWLKQFEESIPTVSLPIDYPRPQLRTYKSNQLNFSLENDLIDKLKKVGAQSGASFVTTLMTAFEVFLYSQTGQNDLVLGLSAAGQSINGKIHLVGHCVNLLPLRSKIDSSSSFKDYLKVRKISILDAYDHQQLSFGELIQQLAITRDPSRVPLVPVTFNIDMGMDNAVEFSGLDYKLKSNPREFEAFELFLNVSGKEDNLTFQWSYNTSLFKSSTIKKMMASFEEILRGIVENPTDSIDNLVQLDTSASIEIANTQIPSPDSLLKETDILNNEDFEEATLVDLFISQVRKTPNNTAVAFEAKKISYKELDLLSNQFANYIINVHDIKINDLVSITLERSEWIIISIMGILKAGAAYVPIDPNYPEKRKNYITQDSQSKITIDRSFITDFINEQEKLSPLLNASINITPEHLCYIIYTSGTTGNPKGVMIEHKSVVNLIASQTQCFNINEGEHILQFSNYCFDASVEQIFLALLNGASLFMVDKQVLLNNQLPKFISENKITHLHATPSYLETLSDLSENKSLKRIIAGGEACSQNLAERLAKNCDFYNEYGPTETTVTSTIYKFNTDVTNTPILSIGKPIDNTQAYIVSEALELLSDGQEGELCLGGKGLARGYFNRPELTSEKFVNNPFLPNEKMYRTGDYARWNANGNLEFIGRKDDQVKIRGYRIELMEVEAALNTLPSIKRAIVTTSKHMAGELSIVAYIQSKNTQIASNEIKNQLGQILPEFQIPAAFMLVENFSLTANGKIDRNALPQFETNAVNADFIEPTTASEKIIAAIWQESLGIEKVGINDDFFELGGHSLLGNKVMALIEKETGNRIPLVSLLTNSTVKKLAAFMDQEFFAWNSLVPLKPEGTKTPIYIVHGANHHVLIFNELAQHLDKDQPVFGLQSRGLNGNDEPHDSIHDMAADYVKEIVASNPEGPYALAGFSLGGIVAYEMARQLKAQGKEVTILAQFDTYVIPPYYFKSKLKKKLVSVGYLIGKVGFILVNMFTSRKKFFRRLELMKILIRGKYLRLKYGKEKQTQMQFNVSSKLYENHNKGIAEYTMTPQDIVIDLFRAREDVVFVHDHDLLGWKGMPTKGIRKHMVDGNHVDMFEKPQVAQFANLLQNVLDSFNSEEIE